MEKKPKILIIGNTQPDSLYLELQRVADKMKIPLIVVDPKDVTEDMFLKITEAKLKLEDFSNNEIYKSEDHK